MTRRSHVRRWFAALRRSDLLEAAQDLIAQSGSRSVSTSEVAAAAGYSRGIVTHQFANKKELLRRVVEYSQSLVDVSRDITGLDWILELVDKCLSTAAEGRTGTSAFLLMGGEAVANDEHVRDLFIERDNWFRSQISAAVERGVVQGGIRDDADGDAFAYLLIAILRGSVLQLLLSPDAGMIPRLRSECATMVRRHLGRAGAQ